MSDHVWVWQAPPGWPPPPPGWSPPPGWQPPPDWPVPPADWQYWRSVPAGQVRHGPGAVGPLAPGQVPVAVPGATVEAPAGNVPWSPTGTIRVDEPTRPSIVFETWFVMLAFIVPGVTAAVIELVRHLQHQSDPNLLNSVVPHHPLSNFLLGILSYLSVATVVPLALLLLVRTGQRPAALGIGRPRSRLDIWPAVGLGAASFGCEVLIENFFVAIVGTHSSLVNSGTALGHVPAYYVVYALTTAATTAIAEEVVVNGYLVTRLEQMGWSPQRILILSLTLRTSYHVYYGLGFILTVPFGYLVTRSFQKHHRLTRSIMAHFLYDAVLLTIAVLVS
ncbi:MAG: CPBP family intramembrane glutamic endopeptidase [Acidimicrobiales bacterium]